MNQARLARVLRNMERDGLTQIVISSTASVYYLTGYWVEPMERMLALYIRADGTCRLFANALFALEPQEGLELVLHQDSDAPTAALSAALYKQDEGMTYRRSHENPVVQKVYADFLGEPGGHKAHALLHCSYIKQKRYRV